MTNAFRSLAFKNHIELSRHIVPYATGMRAIRFVQHCNITSCVWYKSEELDYVARESETGLLEELHELLNV